MPIARASLARLRALRHRSRSVRSVSGVRSKLTMARLVAAEALLGERTDAAADSAVPVLAKKFGRRTVWLRPRSSDPQALQFLNYGHHLPPAELSGPVEHIAVFGANIGLLLSDLGARYPGARLLGVEPDHQNAILARHNLAHLDDRCTLRETAVWYRDETLTLNWERDAWGLKVTDPPQEDSASPGIRRIDAVNAAALLSDFAGDAPIDYLLINIESAWYEMLRHGEWANNVRCINIEMQDHYDEAIPLLKELGYEASLRLLSWGAFAAGTRPA
jgi:hypothetical protein